MEIYSNLTSSYPREVNPLLVVQEQFLQEILERTNPPTSFHYFTTI
jgi:hypothetical protein